MSRPVLLDSTGRPMPRAARDDRASAMAGWTPARRAPDWSNFDRDLTVGRARDMVETDGYAAASITKTVDAIVGARLRLRHRPNWRALGITEAEARDVSEQVDAEWSAFCDDPRFYCDATRQTTMGGLFALAYRHYLLDGDALAVLSWDDDRPYGTTVRIVHPDLMCNPHQGWDTPNLRGGVELDDDGAAIAYHLRGAHDRTLYGDPRAWAWQRIERETSWGRPTVAHFFDRHSDGQTRGLSRLDPVIEALKMQDKHGRVELQAAVLDAVMAPFVKTNGDIEALSDVLGQSSAGAYIADRGSYYTEGAGADIRVGDAQLNRLYVGDEMGVAAARRPAAGFEPFQRQVLRKIAAGIGISYEQMTADWSAVNYSSARAALNEIWRSWNQRRLDFSQRFCAPIFAAWMEEAVDTGRVVLPAGAPGFEAGFAAWVRVEAIGPGRGFVDPVKEANAAGERIRLGLSTLERETAELGGDDWRDVQAQLAREMTDMAPGVRHPAQGEPVQANEVTLAPQ